MRVSKITQVTFSKQELEKILSYHYDVDFYWIRIKSIMRTDEIIAHLTLIQAENGIYSNRGVYIDAEVLSRHAGIEVRFSENSLIIASDGGLIVYDTKETYESKLSL